MSRPKEDSFGFVKNTANRYIAGAVQPDLSPEELEALIAYARDKFGGERYPFAQVLRAVREVLDKVVAKPKPEPPTPRKPYVPSLIMTRKKRR